MKKTSALWCEELRIAYDPDTEKLPDRILTIRDPDGWDRKSFDVSFFQELITLHEFISRLQMATLTNVKDEGRRLLNRNDSL